MKVVLSHRTTASFRKVLANRAGITRLSHHLIDTRFPLYDGLGGESVDDLKAGGSHDGVHLATHLAASIFGKEGGNHSRSHDFPFQGKHLNVSPHIFGVAP